MVPFGVLVAFDCRKLLRSGVVRGATLAVLLLTTVTTVGGFAAARYAAGTDIGRKSASMVGSTDWPGYVGLSAMSVGVTMLLAAGFVMAWCVGREFADGTIVGLFAVPATRASIAAAKVVAVSVWVSVVGCAVAATSVAGGLALGLPWSGAGRAALVIGVVAVSLGVSAMPVMWVATRWRGYLAGIAAALGLVVMTNVAAGFGAGRFIPWAIPVLWATPGGDVPIALLSLPIGVALLGAWAVRRSWAGLELGRR